MQRAGKNFCEFVVFRRLVMLYLMNPLNVCYTVTESSYNSRPRMFEYSEREGHVTDIVEEATLTPTVRKLQEQKTRREEELEVRSKLFSMIFHVRKIMMFCLN